MQSRRDTRVKPKSKIRVQTHHNYVQEIGNLGKENPRPRRTCKSCRRRETKRLGMGSPSAGLTTHGIHGNTGRLTIHLAKNKRMSTPATAEMGKRSWQKSKIGILRSGRWRRTHAGQQHKSPRRGWRGQRCYQERPSQDQTWGNTVWKTK